MNIENTNWEQSVAGVLIKENKVLLARHTYGNVDYTRRLCKLWRNTSTSLKARIYGGNENRNRATKYNWH